MSVFRMLNFLFLHPHSRGITVFLFSAKLWVGDGPCFSLFSYAKTMSITVYYNLGLCELLT